MEFLQIIALLCQVNIGAMGLSIEKVEDAQKKCHKFFVKCVEVKVKPSFDERLRDCILERE